MSARAKKLYFVGDGSRGFGYLGVPGRDLTEEETAALSDEVYDTITGEQGDGEKSLYQVTKPRGRKDDEPPAAPPAATDDDQAASAPAEGEEG